VLWRRFLQSSLTFLMVKMFYYLLELHLDCSFLLDLLLHSLCSFCHCFPSCHLLLHGSQTLILLAKPPVLDDGESYGLLPPASTFAIAFGFNSCSSPGCTPSLSPRCQAKSQKLLATYKQNLRLQRHCGYGTLTCGGGLR
jgi:hypothetical protein